MGDLISRSVLLESMGKVIYKNVPVEHQPYVQATFEALEAVTINVPAVDAVEVVRCKDCIHRGNECNCPMCWTEWYDDPDDGYDMVFRDNTTDDGFCYCGAKNDAEE